VRLTTTVTTIGVSAMLAACGANGTTLGGGRVGPGQSVAPDVPSIVTALKATSADNGISYLVPVASGGTCRVTAILADRRLVDLRVKSGVPVVTNSIKTIGLVVDDPRQAQCVVDLEQRLNEITG
jgi:hypothetical protein